MLQLFGVDLLLCTIAKGKGHTSTGFIFMDLSGNSIEGLIEGLSMVGIIESFLVSNHGISPCMKAPHTLLIVIKT